MAAAFIFAGTMHFVKPKFFLKIVPKWVPYPQWANWISGFFEIVFGVGLLFKATQSISAWGLIALLVAVFPANWYHYQMSRGTKAEKYTLARLPFQLLFIWWAYQYT